MRLFRSALIAIPLFCAHSVPLAETGVELEPVIDVRIQAQIEAARSQARVDELADETRELLQQYRQATRRADNLRDYNDQLERQVDRQNERIASLERQIEEVEVTRREIVPLLLAMVDALEQFVELDLPFLVEERRERIEGLHRVMDDPDTTVPEQYRRVMEAYLVEVEYGRTIEAYRGTLERDGEARTVEFLRFGRVGLYYRTFDGEEVGHWDRAAERWATLGPEYRRSIRQGLRMARDEAPPDLLRLPVPAPEDAL